MFQKSSPLSPLSVEEQHVAGHDDVETVVGPSVHVEGDFASEGNILVKGTVSGNVQTTKRLTVEPSAKILANVRAGDAIISGQIKGNIRVANRLELTQSAQVLGDVMCQVFVVEAGALVHGKVSMKGMDMEEDKTEKTRLTKRPKVREENEPTEMQVNPI